MQVRVNDYVCFTITGSGGTKLVVRVLSVQRHNTFREMLLASGVDACLPGVASLDEAVRIYHSFGTWSGETFEDLERRCGVVAIQVTSLVGAADAAFGS